MARSHKRKDNISHDIPKEMANSLDTILRMEGRKHAIESRSELIRRVLSDLISYYENDTFYKAKTASKDFLHQEREWEVKTKRKHMVM
jgi:metal-responsive CopG/Arc/MetJ family transcriptional regulator